jgi:hypothetical protein
VQLGHEQRLVLCHEPTLRRLTDQGEARAATGGALEKPPCTNKPTLLTVRPQQENRPTEAVACTPPDRLGLAQPVELGVRTAEPDEAVAIDARAEGVAGRRRPGARLTCRDRVEVRVEEQRCAALGAGNGHQEVHVATIRLSEAVGLARNVWHHGLEQIVDQLGSAVGGHARDRDHGPRSVEEIVHAGSV